MRRLGSRSRDSPFSSSSLFFFSLFRRRMRRILPPCLLCAVLGTTHWRVSIRKDRGNARNDVVVAATTTTTARAPARECTRTRNRSRSGPTVAFGKLPRNCRPSDLRNCRLLTRSSFSMLSSSVFLSLPLHLRRDGSAFRYRKYFPFEISFGRRVPHRLRAFSLASISFRFFFSFSSFLAGRSVEENMYATKVSVPLGVTADRSPGGRRSSPTTTTASSGVARSPCRLRPHCRYFENDPALGWARYRAVATIDDSPRQRSTTVYPASFVDPSSFSSSFCPSSCASFSSSSAGDYQLRVTCALADRTRS